ncbi:MAG: hypothetical protein R3277_05775 [Brumimicrobium sp.]|nr:hypothetical protein [Brumimicrobium sp.]
MEIGGSHDECILTPLKSLKEAGYEVFFCGTKEIFNRNLYFQELFDGFHEIKLTGKGRQDFLILKKFNQWLCQEKIFTLILNTAQGGHIRNLVLSSRRKVKFFGVLHTIKKLEGSFTQKIISLKVKNYFLLNDTLVKKANYSGSLNLHVYYPLDFPIFDKTVPKREDEFWITLIGGVENRRKDLNSFTRLALESPEHFRFIFLGKSDQNDTYIQSFKKALKKEGLESRVQLFDHFVDQPTFDAYLKNTDVILPLVHPNTKSSEEYFSRQIPGSINVAFSYHIPLLIHEEYKSWEDFQSGCIFYNAESYRESLISVEKNHDSLVQDIVKNPKFSKEHQRQQFIHSLENSKK